MTLRSNLAALAVGAAMVAASAGSAATINLTNAGDATGNGSAVALFSSGGITGSVVAGCDVGGNSVNCDGTTYVPTIRLTNNGMGVRSRGHIAGQLDTSNGGEFLTFVFDFAVNLLGIDFHALSAGEYYDLFIGGTQVADNQTGDPWTTAFFNVTSLTIKADGNGKFLVRGIEAVAAQRQVGEVPLPATGLLLAAGLGGLVIVRRRKSV